MNRTITNNPLLRRSRQAGRHVLSLLLTRPRLSIIGILLITAGLTLGWFTDLDEAANNTASQDLLSHGQTLALQSGNSLPPGLQPGNQAFNNHLIQTGDQASEQAPTTSVTTAAATATYQVQTDNEYDWQPVTVSTGDNLGAIFKQRALSPGLVHNIVNLNEDTKNLTRLKVGESLDIAYTADGQFQALRRAHTEQEWLIVERNDAGLVSKRLIRDIARRERSAAGVISGNLFISGKEAGLKDGLIMQLARIFGWDIDFALDIRRGDRFVLIYEEIWRDGEYLRDGEIIAASFINRGEVFQALRFQTDNGVDYFSADGEPMRKAFLRTPLDVARVTSNFNPRRMHPVLNRVRPHNGVDYGAATGTPVYATGDGTVIAAAYSRPNGNYVFIRHTNDIVTKYLHFSKRSVSKGQRVKQGQTIGYVGATGLATAPHLHYEFVVGGRHRNPRTVDLPEATPLSSAQTETLRLQHQDNIERLATLDAAQQPLSLTAAGGQ